MKKRPAPYAFFVTFLAGSLSSFFKGLSPEGPPQKQIYRRGSISGRKLPFGFGGFRFRLIRDSHATLRLLIVPKTFDFDGGDLGVLPDHLSTEHY